MENKWLEGYNKHEDELIEKYNQHPFFKQIDRVSEKVFKQYLLQLGHISMEFVKFLEIAKHGFNSETAREAARHILRDEIPVEGPTHQDNRIYDLKMLEFSLNEILNTPASSQTKETLRGYYDLVKYPQDHQDIRILVAIRVIGEVLVGETYKHVVEQLIKRYGIKPESSLFYTFHWQHDQKGGTGDTGGEGHTEYYDKALAELIQSKEDLEVAKEAADKALQVRWDFHDQFFQN